MQKIRRVSACLVAIVVMSMTFVARGQVLDQVPADAMVVVKVKNLEGTSKKFSKFCQDLGVAAMVPQLQDPLGTLQSQMKINSGLDKAGEFAFVFIDPSSTGGDPEQSMLMLVPVTDYAEFLKNFPEAKTDAGVSEVQFGPADHPSFTASWGKYAVLTPNKAIAAMKPTGIKAKGAATLKELDSRDLVLFANMAKVKAVLQPELAKNREEILSEVEKGMSGEPQAVKFTPAAKALVNQVLNAVDSFLSDADSATFSVNFAPDGVQTSLMAEFAPDTYLGKFIASHKNTDAELLAGLPAGKYLFFAGGVSDPAVSGKMFDDFLGPVLAELPKIEGDLGTGLTKYAAALRTFVASSTGSAMGMVTPSGALGQDAIIQSIWISRGDGAKMKAAYNDMMSTQDALMKGFAGGAEMPMKMVVTPNGKTVEGVTFDVVKTEFKFDQNDPNAAQAEQMMKMMYGPNGMTAMTGVVGNNLIAVSGVTDAVLASTVKAVTANQDSLSKIAGVKAVQANLPTNRLAVIFVPVDEIAATVATYASAMGFNIPIQLPPDLPPIGAAIAVEGTAMRIDSYTPTPLVQSLIAAGMQAAMQMQGGRQPGGPGGL